MEFSLSPSQCLAPGVKGKQVKIRRSKDGAAGDRCDRITEGEAYWCRSELHHLGSVLGGEPQTQVPAPGWCTATGASVCPEIGCQPRHHFPTSRQAEALRPGPPLHEPTGHILSCLWSEDSPLQGRHAVRSRTSGLAATSELREMLALPPENLVPRGSHVPPNTPLPISSGLRAWESAGRVLKMVTHWSWNICPLCPSDPLWGHSPEG